MSGGHAHGLILHRNSYLHQVPPQCKVAATLTFVLVVVATPIRNVGAFPAYTTLLIAWALWGGVPLTWVARKFAFETPFILFALFLPFLGEGPKLDLAGFSLSVEGLWGAFNIVAKATLGLGATVVLAATTEMAAILHGLEHLRMPRVITAIAGFMVRYADVVSGEMKRMRIARESRCYNPRWFWQGGALASSAGTLFIRSFERGERVHLAMLSRGFNGALPMVRHRAATLESWLAVALLPGAAMMVGAVAWIL